MPTSVGTVGEIFREGQCRKRPRKQTGVPVHGEASTPVNVSIPRIDKHPRVVKKKASAMAHWPQPLTPRKGASHADPSPPEFIRRLGPAQTQCVLWSYRPRGPTGLPSASARRLVDDLAGAPPVSPAIESHRCGIALQLVFGWSTACRRPTIPCAWPTRHGWRRTAG